MKYIKLIVLCLIYVFTFLNFQCNCAPDASVAHYWREYTRDIPEDAIPGGVDKRGKVTYIGQTLHIGCQTGVIVTGQIHEAEKSMTYEWGYKEYKAENPVQILCSRDIERYGWIKTNSEDIQKWNTTYLVKGGVEKNYKFYIGRVAADGELAVGKVLVTNETSLVGFYTTLDGKYLRAINSFEVLSSDPNIPPERRKQVTKSGNPNSSVTNSVWQPILIFSVLQMLYYAVK